MNVFTMSLEVLVARGGEGSFVLSINYCQLNTLSICSSILYCLMKAFMTHTRNRPVFDCRADCSKHSLFPNSLSEWSQYAPEIQNLKSIAVFKNKLLSFIRPSKRSIFNVNNPEGVKYLKRSRIRFSHLNEHKFRHGFLDTLNPLCNYILEFEENEHLFLRCLKFENARKSLFIEISSINSSFKNFSSHLKVGLLLFVDSELSAIDNNLI